ALTVRAIQLIVRTFFLRIFAKNFSKTLKGKYILIVLFFIVVWFFIRNYRSVVHSYQFAGRAPTGKLANGKKQDEWNVYYVKGNLNDIKYYKNDTLNGQILL